MAKKIDLELKGLSGVLKSLEKLPRDVAGKTVNNSLREGAKKMRDAVQDNIDKRVKQNTGTLRRSITYRKNARENKGSYFSNDNVSAYMVTVKGGKNATYPDGTRAGLVAGVIEYGKSNQEANPIFRDAYEQNAEEVSNKIAQELIDGVEKAFK